MVRARGTSQPVLLLACALMVLPSLLGMLLVSSMSVARPRREETPEAERPPIEIEQVESRAHVVDLTKDHPVATGPRQASRIDALVEVVMCDASSGRTVIDAIVAYDPSGLLGDEGTPVSFGVALADATLVDVCGQLDRWARDGVLVAVTALVTGEKVVALLRAPGLAVPTTVLTPAIH